METPDTYSAFEGHKLLCWGTLSEAVLAVKRQAHKHPTHSFLIFSDATGKAMDFNLQGSESEVVKRLEVYVTPPTAESEAQTGPGRPKLGVVSREVSLLPRHWEWLAAQPGGASGTLRKLVEDAKKKSKSGSEIKQAKERAYKFMAEIAGDFAGYEEALRALYRGEKDQFKSHMASWPADVRHHALRLAKPAFATGE
jgi:hypothetical protein